MPEDTTTPKTRRRKPSPPPPCSAGSDTPVSDAATTTAISRHNDGYSQSYFSAVPLDVARRLERERNEARQQLRSLAAAVYRARVAYNDPGSNGSVADQMYQELAPLALS